MFKRYRKRGDTHFTVVVCATVKKRNVEIRYQEILKSILVTFIIVNAYVRIYNYYV